MYVKEMHIGVSLATQKIAGNKNRKLLPEEIDWLLYKNMQRFIQSRVTPKSNGSGGYEINAFDTDAIRPLMKTGVKVPAWVDSSKRVKVVLPGDCDYLISDESIVKRMAAGMTMLDSTLTDHYLAIPILPSARANGPWYTVVTLLLNGSVAFDIQAYALARGVTNFNGYNSPDQVYEVADCIFRVLSDAGWEVYWQNYGEIYQPNTLFVVTGGVTATGSINIDGRSTPGVSGTQTVIARDLPMQAAQDQTNRLTSSNILPNLREVAFYKTQPESPLTETAGNLLYVYVDNTFIVTNVRLSYVRKPRRISLILGQDCELLPAYHQNICDLTVEYFKAMIADPNWETTMKDNMVRTPV